MSFELSSTVKILVLFFFFMSLWAPVSGHAAGLTIQDELISFDRLSDHFYTGGDTKLHPTQQQVYDLFQQAKPEIQKLILLKKYLIPFLQSYAEENGGLDSEMTRRYIDLIQNRLLTRDYSSNNQVRVSFEAHSSDEGRFQVDGVAQDRLAVNTGTEIFFNVRGLTSQHLDLPAMVQLWLHEISHLDDKTSLEVRDTWGARVSTWLRSKTQTFDFLDGKVTAILLPPPKAPSEIWVRDNGGLASANEAFANAIKEHFLILFENAAGSRPVQEFYDNIKTFDDRLGSDVDLWSQRQKVLWPRFKVLSVKKSSQGSLQVEYEQAVSGLYSPHTYSSQLNLSPSQGEALTLTPQIPTNRYRVDIDLAQSTADVQRAYSKPLQEGDFEVYRLKNVAGRRYLSLRLKLPAALKTLNSSESIHVVAKNLQSQKLLSFVVQKIRPLNSSEVLLHLEVPAAGFEISQILLPRVTGEGFYSEVSVRPSMPAKVEGPQDFTESQLKVESLDIPQREHSQDKMIGTLRVQTNKKIVGLTLDVQHLLRADQVSFQYIPTSTTNVAMVGAGRKYFLQGKQITVQQKDSDTLIRFNFPESTMKQIQDGPVVTTTHSVFYKEKKTLRGQTLTDFGQREVRNIWVHFADGTIKKVPVGSLPQITTLISKDQERQIYEQARKRAASYYDVFDSPQTPPRCGAIFL